MKVIDGRTIAGEMEEEIGEKAKGKKIKIATVVIEGNSESWLFARLKDKACKRVGIEHEIIGLENVSQERAEEEIKKLSEDETITGINIQLPLPPSIDYNSLVKKIDVRKDIEGMHPSNLGNLMLGREDMIPCTPKAVLKILEHEGIELKGKNVVIINHSNIIGKPLAILLLNRNSTVSVCHVYTQNLQDYTRKAEILITATGVKGLIKGEDVSESCIIVDAGIKEENGRVYGDVDKSAAEKARAITPVPGGVGPVTIASMLDNAVIAYEKLHK